MNFFQWLRGRGLERMKLIVGDKYLGMLEAGTQWGNKKYLNMKHLEAALAEAVLAG